MRTRTVPTPGHAAGVPSTAGQRHSCAALLKTYRSCNHSLAVYLANCDCRTAVWVQKGLSFHTGQPRARQGSTARSLSRVHCRPRAAPVLTAAAPSREARAAERCQAGRAGERAGPRRTRTCSRGPFPAAPAVRTPVASSEVLSRCATLQQEPACALPVLAMGTNPRTRNSHVGALGNTEGKVRLHSCPGRGETRPGQEQQ